MGRWRGHDYCGGWPQAEREGGPNNAANALAVSRNITNGSNLWRLDQNDTGIWEDSYHETLQSLYRRMRASLGGTAELHSRSV
jgi:hypothetical protein